MSKLTSDIIRKPAMFVFLASSCGAYLYYKGSKAFVNENQRRPNKWPRYTMEEVSKHATKEQNVWVTYKDGVYDITKFIDEHPGGDNIMLAAGAAVDPFWMIYGVHKSEAVLEMLKKYRIGVLSQDETEDNINVIDPYSEDPKRSSVLRINSEKPFNAEPPLPLLVNNFITPNEVFYIRNHLPVPIVDADSYELEVSGLGNEETTFSLHDLKNKFPKVTIVAAIQCAGSRRSEMAKIKPVKGLNWDAGAIGNATWSGVRLKDVLDYCAFPNTEEVQHVQFEGMDTDPKNTPYGASIPVEKALDPLGDVILAYEMNGKTIPRDHGYPIRVIVPGVVGARNVKWLGRIKLSKYESDSHWQQNDYKGFSPSVHWETVDFKSAPAIQELPVVSAICDPIGGQKVTPVDGKIKVKGYAWSGGGRKIVRVDVTTDKGKTWIPAKIAQDDKNAKLTHCWAWSLWEISIPVEASTNQVEIWAKAVDSSYNNQPESFEHIWNLRGVLANAYHKIKLDIYRDNKIGTN